MTKNDCCMQRVSNVNNAINKKRFSCFNIASFNRFRFYRLPLIHKFDCGVRALKMLFRLCTNRGTVVFFPAKDQFDD